MARGTVHICYALRAAFTDAERKSFGNVIAEPLIFGDYTRCTQGNPIGPGETDWWDEGPLATRVSRYIDVLNRRHDIKKTHLQELSNRGGKGALRIPDILTFRGRLVTPAGPTAVPSRHEFYEIKPRSESGLFDGRSKIKSIETTFAYCNGFLGAKNLHYQKGITYPTEKEWPGGIARLPLINLRKGHKRAWRRALEVAMKRFGISQVEVYLEVRRTDPALLTYRICVKFQTDDRDEDAEQLGRDLVYACVSCETAFMNESDREAVLEVARGIEVAGFERDGVDRFYLGKFQSQRIRSLLVDVKILKMSPHFLPFLQGARDVMNSRGLGLPYDRYMICAEDEFYFSVMLPIIEDPVLRTLKRTPTEWMILIKDRLTTAGATDALIQTRAQALEASGWAIKTLANFAREHPGETAAYLTLIVLATALLCVAAGVGTAAVGEGAVAGQGVAGAEATAASEGLAASGETQAITRAVMRDFQRLEAGAAESALARADAIANATTAPMTGGAAEATQALQLVLPRTAATSALRTHIVSKSARVAVSAASGLTLALGAHTASAHGRQGGADAGQPSTPSAAAGEVNFSRLVALRPYNRAEWTAGKYPDPETLRVGERLPSRFSPDDTRFDYRFIGLIQLT